MSQPLTTPPLPTDKTAVEVVATFGDAVVGVRHLTDPNGGVVRAATKALLASGAALIATSAIAFGWATHVAAKNQAALKAWTAAKKPAYAFRPEMLPVGLDALTLGGSVLGLGAVAWGLARRKSELAPARVRLGTAVGCDFPLEGVGSAFDLVAPAGDAFAVHVAPGMTGAPVGPIALTPATKLRLQLGATTFHVQAVTPPKPTAAGLSFDRRAAGYFAASALAHLGLVALLGTVPSGMDTAAADDSTTEPVAVDVSATATRDPVPTPDETDGNLGATTPGERAAMALLEGQTGTDHPTGDPARRQIQRRDGAPRLSRTEAIERAREAGIFGSELMASGDHFASVTGEADLTTGMDDADIYGSWDGNGDGSLEGFGTGKRGHGPGGGGKDWDSIYAGDYNTIHGGPGDGDDYNLPGDKDGKLRPHQKKVPPIFCKGDECKVIGDVDPTIVRRYMKQNGAKISFCYEKQLIANPDLEGTVATSFMVMPDGHTTQINASGVSDDVSSCIAGVISNIHFPKFASAFQVKYPFHMHKTGA